MSEPEAPDAPDSAIARMRGPSRKTLIAISAAALLVLVAAVALFFVGAGSTAEASRRYGDFWGCVAGDSLAEGERAELRMRAVAAALGEKRGDWPHRCQQSLDSFYASLPSDPKSEAIRQLMDVELACQKKCDSDKIVAVLPQIDTLARAAKIRPQGDRKIDPPSRLDGVPLQDRDFDELLPGVLTLRGIAAIGEGKKALLYRDQSNALYLCEADPDDAEAPAKCGVLETPVLPQSARLVEGKTQSIIHGIVKMGATPEETEYGAFSAWTNERVAEELGALTLASDRPRLGVASRTWFDADVGGTKATLTRLESGVLSLTRGETRTFVMDDAEHGGPATGEPFAVIGKTRALVLFQGKKGISALIVPPEGKPEPAKKMN